MVTACGMTCGNYACGMACSNYACGMACGNYACGMAVFGNWLGRHCGTLCFGMAMVLN